MSTARVLLATLTIGGLAFAIIVHVQLQLHLDPLNKSWNVYTQSRDTYLIESGNYLPDNRFQNLDHNGMKLGFVHSSIGYSIFPDDSLDYSLIPALDSRDNEYISAQSVSKSLLKQVGIDLRLATKIKNMRDIVLISTAAPASLLALCFLIPAAGNGAKVAGHTGRKYLDRSVQSVYDSHERRKDQAMQNIINESKQE